MYFRAHCRLRCRRPDIQNDDPKNPGIGKKEQDASYPEARNKCTFPKKLKLEALVQP